MRKPGLLKFTKVNRIPVFGEVVCRSKYSPYLIKLSRFRKGTKVKVRNGSLSAAVLYGHLKDVCKWTKITNLDFVTRKKQLYCKVK